MFVSRIALDTFRSWKHIICDFQPGINIILGNNGLGKTNIVESLEIVGTGISHRTSSTLPLVTRGYETSTIRINVCANKEDTTYEVTLSIKGANRARINSGKSLYMREIAGLLPVVSFTPRDQSLIFGDPNIRRTFLDQAGTLLLPNYAQLIQEFRHIAKQRAALLKNIRENSYSERNISLSGLEIWTGRFIESGIAVTRARNQVVTILNNSFTQLVQNLTNNSENAILQYAPSFEEVLKSYDSHNELLQDIGEHFQRIYEGELARGCNLIGPHRDDVNFMLDSMLAKDFASNGESWTLAIAAKMALCKALEEKNRDNPVIILDDVFAQLDEQRRQQILNFAEQQGQVFITTSSISDIPNSIENSDLCNHYIIDVADLTSQQDDDINSLHTTMLKGILAQRSSQENDAL